MGTVIRPVFQNGERLTAQRLNEIVEYLRTSLRRVLLAPLSPGVAAGLELGGTPPRSLPGPFALATEGPLFAVPQTAPVDTVTVSPGVALDRAGRILVSTQGTSFTPADILSQITDIAEGENVIVSLGADTGAASSVAEICAPSVGQSVSEGVKLYFTRGRLPIPVPPLAHIPAWADPLDQGKSAAVLSVPLGSVIYSSTALIPSAQERTGVMPSVGALLNSFGDPSVELGRTANGTPAVAVAVPTVFGTTAPAFFNTYAGGPLVQAATVATNLGQPPAGRANSSNNTVFEAAGGNYGIPIGGSPGVAGAPGTTGVMAISMVYDTGSGGAQGFNTVPHPGFPLVLSQSAGNQPMVAPPLSANSVGSAPNYVIGLSTGVSYSDAASGQTLVPVAIGGIVLAWVFPTASPQPVGTLLKVSSTPNSTGSTGQWWLTPATNADVVVAQLATPIPASSTGAQQAFVWVVPPANLVPYQPPVAQ